MSSRFSVSQVAGTSEVVLVAWILARLRKKTAISSRMTKALKAEVSRKPASCGPRRFPRCE